MEFMIAFGILSAILWLIIGWRAMRAHEKIGDQVKRYVDFATTPDLQNLRKENAVQHKLYKSFLLQHPDAETQPPKERHERFRLWLGAQGESTEG